VNCTYLESLRIGNGISAGTCTDEVGADGIFTGTCICGELGDPIVGPGTIVDGATTGIEVGLGTDGFITGAGVDIGTCTGEVGASTATCIGEPIVGTRTVVDGATAGVEVGLGASGVITGASVDTGT
jgi:hypothetical protein